MNEQQAGQLASIVGGGAQAWQSGGDIWLVSLTRNDGKVVVFSSGRRGVRVHQRPFAAW